MISAGQRGAVSGALYHRRHLCARRCHACIPHTTSQSFVSSVVALCVCVGGGGGATEAYFYVLYMIRHPNSGPLCRRIYLCDDM